uniref:Uncharacterized protein n=1 Tax=Plectus sambesii TaxID=2011161 RepID=A0A914VXM9_9BILA
MPTTSVTGVIDGDFAPYRDFYTRRVQRLERFKKARSFCCVVSDDELAIASLPPPPPPPITPPPASSSTGLDAKFTELRQKMISPKSRRDLGAPPVGAPFLVPFRLQVAVRAPAPAPVVLDQPHRPTLAEFHPVASTQSAAHFGFGINARVALCLLVPSSYHNRPPSHHHTSPRPVS